MATFADSDSYLVYGEESVIGTPPASVDSYFGVNISANSNIDNNLRVEAGLGFGRVPQSIKAGVLDTKIPVEFKMINGAFLKYALGSVSGAGTGASPYAYALASKPKTLTIEQAVNFTIPQVFRHAGCYNVMTKLKLAINQPIIASMDFVGQNIIKAEDGYQSLTPPTSSIFNFTSGSIQAPSGTILLEITDADLTVVDNGSKMYPSLFSRNQLGMFGTCGFRGTLNGRMRDGRYLDWVMSGAASATAIAADTPLAKATAVFNFTNGTTRNITLTYANAFCPSWKFKQQQGEPLEENVQFEAMSVSATEQVTT